MNQLTSFEHSNIFTIIGEWSTAPTDCAKWLNGRGVGARWDGTWQPGNPSFGSCMGMSGDMSTFSSDYKTFLRKYVFLNLILIPYSVSTDLHCQGIGNHK